MTRWHTLDGIPDLPEQAFNEQKVGLRSRMTLEGGGGGGNTKSTSYQTNLPAYARPYYEDMMDRAHEESLKGYEGYTGDRVAGFTPNQQTVMGNIYGMGVPDQFAGATGATYGAMDRAGSLTGDRIAGSVYGLSSPYQSSGYQATTFDPGYTAGEMTARQFTPEEAQTYMDPYMQNVVDIQKRSAASDALQKQLMNNYAAQQAESFGGSRHGVVEAAHSKDTMQLLDDIQKKGLQDAYSRAQQTFQADRQAQMDAQAQTEAWRQAQADFGLQAQGMDEQSRQFLEGISQFGAGIDQQTADRMLQALSGDADRSLQAQTTGIQSLLSGAGQLADIGTAQSNLQMAQLKMQEATSDKERQLAQAELDQAYQDFVNARDYDRQQLAFFNALLRGIPVPVQQETIQYQAAPSIGGTLTGAGLASLAANQLTQGTS